MRALDLNLAALDIRRDELATIVRDLGSVPSITFSDAGETGICPICLAPDAHATTKHTDDCAWRRARLWTKANPETKPDAKEAP